MPTYAGEGKRRCIPVESAHLQRPLQSMRPRFLTVFLLYCLLPACAEESQRDFVTVEDQKISYTEYGSGPPVLLLHGLWGGLNEWLPVVDALSESHRVIAMDFIGFHDSDKPDLKYSNAVLSRYLAGFISELGLRNVTLMGHAMGANAATYTAVHHPANISRLVLIDGAGYRNPNRDLSKPPSEGMLRFRKVATGDTPESTRGLLERRVLDKALVTDEWVEKSLAMWRNSAQAIGDMLFEGGDLTEDEMRRIGIPTLVVWGSDDAVFPIENAERLHADIEGAQVRIIEGTGHLPQIENPDEFLSAVVPFLMEVVTVPPSPGGVPNDPDPVDEIPTEDLEDLDPNMRELPETEDPR